ncbi:hypothetical protein, partial [Staphylococcus aureus]|uniref:hypothetical protein n=1 Tax=Staphylococcus aureus TaxID=1280 RepID=UPI00301C8E6A
YYFSNELEIIEELRSVRGILFSAVYIIIFVVLVCLLVIKIKNAVVKDFIDKYGPKGTKDLNRLKIIWLKANFPIVREDYLKYVNDVKPYLNRMSE